MNKKETSSIIQSDKKNIIEKIPSKSSINQMKKKDLITYLDNLSLSTTGKKEDLINRLEEHYRPKSILKKEDISKDIYIDIINNES